MITIDNIAVMNRGDFMAAAKILVVEDEGLTAMEIQRKLRNWGYEVPSFAFSRKEAVKKAEEIKPDLILMDIMLKGQGDGVDAAQEIKSIRDVPIIYITAYDDEKTRKRAEITHPNAYLIKPFEEKELHHKIEKALTEHKLEKNLLNIAKDLDNKLKGFGVLVTDFKGKIIYLNNLASNLTGFTQNIASGKDLSEVFPIEGINKEIDADNDLKVFINENAGIAGRSVLNKDGKDVHVEYNINSILDEKGGFLGAELVFEDITQQLKDEQSLIEREEKFRNIYYQSMLATGIFDEKGNYLDANPACLQLFGVDQVDQLKNFNLFKDFKLDSKELEDLKNGSEVNYEFEFNFEEFKSKGFANTLADVSKYFSLFITPLKSDGTVNGYLVHFQDVSDHRNLEESLKDSQERYLNLLDTLDQVLIAFDDNMKCVYCNNTISQLLDMKNDDIVGKSFQEVMKSFWDGELESMCMETLETGKPSNIIKSLYSDKIPLFVEIKAHKSFEGLIIILNDVTEFQQRENELKQNENLYRTVVNDQREIICRFNQDFQLTFANEAYYRIFGINNKLNVVFSLSEEDLGKMKAQFKSFNEENPIKIFESPIQMPNAPISWWQWVTLAKFDKNGNISEYQSVGRDVTQHHHAMEDAQNNVEKLQFSIKEKNKEFEELSESFKSIDEKNSVLQEVNDSFKLEIDEKNKELEDIKESFKLEINDKNKKIGTLQKLNEDMDKKFKEESQKRMETLNNQIKEIETLRDEEKALKEKLELLEKDLQTKKIEVDNSHKALESEIDLRKKTEEKFQIISADLQEQRIKTEATISEIKTLKIEIQEKEAEISRINAEFESETVQLTKDFEEEISLLKTNFEAKILNLEQRELLTKESLDKKDKALKNVYDGVKKNMQMISTLNRLHSEYVTDQMIAKLQDGRSYLRSFGMVHEKLYQSEDLETVNLEEYLNNILDDILRSHGAKNVDIQIETNDISLDMETSVLSGLIVTELVINSLKHAFPNGSTGMIRVEISSDDNGLVINVSDDGIGIPNNIIAENTDSFGLHLIKTLVEQSEGSMELKGDNGTNFSIKIPKIISN